MKEEGTPCFQFRKLICMIKNCLMAPSTPPSTHSHYNNTSHDISSHLYPVTVFFRSTSQVKKTGTEKSSGLTMDTRLGNGQGYSSNLLCCPPYLPHSGLHTQPEGSSQRLRQLMPLPCSKPSRGSHLPE